MKKKYLIILPAIIANLSCNSYQKETNEKPKNKIVGTWKLIQYSDFDTVTKKWTQPYGDHPKGYFTYTSSGIVNLNGSAENPMIIPSDSINLKPLTLGKLLDNAFGYFGTYTIDSAHSTIIHHVEGGSVLSIIGTDQPRQFIIKGDTLLIGDPTFKIGRRVLIKEH